jgi:holo-[acyl-carrier protein] synthase
MNAAGLDDALYVDLGGLTDDLGNVVLGVGIDLVDAATVERQIAVSGNRYLMRMLTPEELAFCGEDLSRIASRIAGKEAVAKALGTGFREGVRWRDIHIVRADNGAPSVTLAGGAAERADALGILDLRISLTHEGVLAAALVVGVGRKVEK